MLAVSPSANLDPNGAFVVVSGTGYRPNTQLFVMQCRATSGQDHTCNSVGLRKVTTNAAGAFTANAMKVVARFGATDCLQVPCGVKTSAVSDHADDRSEDRNANISFRAAPPATAPPVTVPPTAAPHAAPTTAPPVTVPPTTAPTTSTTTEPKATTTTEARGEAKDEDEAKAEKGGDDGETAVSDETTDADGETDETASAASVTQASADGDGGGSAPVVPIVILVVLVAAGVGGLVFFRSRQSGSAA
jgi:cobalamin biosynthesis Mg chelatase CobN